MVYKTTKNHGKWKVLPWMTTTSRHGADKHLHARTGIAQAETSYNAPAYAKDHTTPQRNVLLAVACTVFRQTNTAAVAPQTVSGTAGTEAYAAVDV
jgi:hypothetical protein